jgi:hypothetical protein
MDEPRDELAQLAANNSDNAHQPQSVKYPDVGDKDAGQFLKGDSENTVSISCPIAVDVPAALESFARLSRLGYFTEAFALFEDNLQEHLIHFPVFAEYADTLLTQGSYGRLSEFLHDWEKRARMADFESEENSVIELLTAFADLHTRGMLPEALKIARDCREKFIWSANETLSDVQVGDSELRAYCAVLKFLRS